MALFLLPEVPQVPLIDPLLVLLVGVETLSCLIKVWNIGHPHSTLLENFYDEMEAEGLGLGL